MTWYREGSFFLGLLIACVVVAKWAAVSAFQIRKKHIDVRMDPEWRMDAERERLKAAAIWKGYKRP